jgi:hypothetical protein
VEIDYYDLYISDYLNEIETGRQLTVSHYHQMDVKHVRYHVAQKGSSASIE